VLVYQKVNKEELDSKNLVFFCVFILPIIEYDFKNKIKFFQKIEIFFK